VSRWALDTNVISEAFKPTPNDGVLRGLATSGATFFVPAPVWHELVYGASRLPASSRRRALESFLELVHGQMTILPYDEAAAAYHARERARLEQLGRPPAAIDAAIAAIAVTHGLTLATRNVGDFAAFTGLTVENWFS
jgi:tRNA(fMet)-specific endonuclease VapC